MSDDLSPEEDVVRRLLAQARHDEPTPDDVVARLDARLAELRAEGLSERPDGHPDGGAHDAPAPVTGLAAARARRRRFPALLAAAAAVVVGGVALTSVLGDGGDSANDVVASDAGGSAASESPYTSQDGAGSGATSESPELLREGASPSPQAVSGVPRLTDDGSLRGAVRRLVAVQPTAGALDDAGPAWPECATTPLPEGRVRWVLVDDRPGAVVELEDASRLQPVEVWLCGGSDALRTYTFRSR